MGLAEGSWEHRNVSFLNIIRSSIDTIICTESL
jgi:hypothetical protein